MKIILSSHWNRLIYAYSVVNYSHVVSYDFHAPLNLLAYQIFIVSKKIII